MYSEQEKKVVMALILIFAVIVGFVAHDLITPSDVNVDCIIDLAESSNIETFAQGYIYETYSIKDVEWLYWQKHPKSRFMVKSALQAILMRCSE